jgi:hypothetical protein
MIGIHNDIKEVINTIQKALEKTHFNEHMLDMGGEWLQDTYEITEDLGCSIGLYEWMTTAIERLKRIQLMGIEGIAFNIEDLDYFLQANELANNDLTDNAIPDSMLS